MSQQSSTLSVSAGNLRGALYMVLTTLSFTCGDALIRVATEDLPLFQVIFLRGCLSCLFLAIALQLTRQWPRNLDRTTSFRIGVRSGAEIGAMIPFFIALIHMPFANVSALLQTLPLTLTLAGAVFLGEPVGLRRLLAILVGFVGVLLIVQPGGSGFSAYSLLVLLAVAFVTLRDLSTRRISRDVSALFLAFVMAVFVAVAAGVVSIWEDWQPLDARLGALILAASITIIGGYTFAALAMRHGEIGFVTPFRYMALVWAVGLGFFVFGEWPDMLTWIGSGIVVSTGLYTLYREQVRRRISG
ncbi:MAG: DMT family transporter [Dinoroseobacter sp.]|nr:DMT family transporter [Dinoroseobacter sp.]